MPNPSAPAKRLAPGGSVQFVGLAADRGVITFHFSPPTPPLTGWHDGTRVAWRWGEGAGPPPIDRNQFGPCERPLLDVSFDATGVAFHWSNRNPQRYGWHDGRGFLPDAT